MLHMDTDLPHLLRQRYDSQDTPRCFRSLIVSTIMRFCTDRTLPYGLKTYWLLCGGGLERMSENMMLKSP
jgi:hypothetical protein